ncbi:MAG: hypothetical protein Q8O48_00350, partial [Anaerolineales bacterium]|nr:hypothetical protein [Anaerolineales bacterium]
MKKILNLLFVILIVLTACDAAITAPLASRPPAVDSVTEDPSATLIDIPLAAGYGVDGGWFELYFTNP